MKKISVLIMLVISITVGCKKKETSSEETTASPTPSTPAPTVINKKWQVFDYNPAYYDSCTLGDVYFFQANGGPYDDYFSLDQGSTITYSAVDPQILTGRFMLSGDLLQYTHNGYALKCSCPNPSYLNSKWVQMNIVYLTKDTLMTYNVAYGGNSWLRFKAVP